MLSRRRGLGLGPPSSPRRMYAEFLRTMRAGVVPVMLGYCPAWLGSLWVAYLGGVSLAIAIFRVGLLGAGVLAA